MTGAQLALALDACAAPDHDTAECRRCIEAMFGDGTLRLLVDGQRRIGASAYIGIRWPKADDDVAVVHVLSKPAGGEIRGYVLTSDGALRLRLPCYSGSWPALDEAVRSRVAGAQAIAPYNLSAGGMDPSCGSLPR